MTQNLIFVLGGAESGKSAFAEGLAARIAEGTGGLLYIATGAPGDAEMAGRIDRHRARRGAEWRTIEAPQAPATALAQMRAGEVALLDCATLWLANRMEAEADIATETEALVDALHRAVGPVVVVSNETGLGIVPSHPVSRAFRSAQGLLNQQLAAAADTAVLVVAGLPLVLKGALP